MSSHQVWIQCPKTETQNLKDFLKEKLCRLHKIRKADGKGFVLVPTKFLSDEVHSRKVVNELFNSIEPSLKAMLKAPIERAVTAWLESLSEAVLAQDGFPSVDELAQDIPKRWSVYHPMVLLPQGSFQSKRWKPLLDHMRHENRTYGFKLWEAILEAIQRLEAKAGDKRLTHLAINAGIPLEANKNSCSSRPEYGTSEDLETDHDGVGTIKKQLLAHQNFLRSPSGLIMLYGDFGPTLGDVEDDYLPKPTAQDFENAFWVSTVQNGIHQTWAPRYTMFSRGNIKEKARLLDFHSFDHDNSLKPEVDSRRTAFSRADLQQSVAVDLYAGIGYFVFSYLAMGIGRVFCWEINPWSTEGLRRGAARNGWSIKILSEQELSDLTLGRKSISTILSTGERIVVFPESNASAYNRLNTPGQACRDYSPIHVNCGLLPSSESSWQNAARIIDSANKGGWMHVHENVALTEIENMRSRILSKLWLNNIRPHAEVEHVELVKTFAPGVWHCVFDVYIGPGSKGPASTQDGRN